MIFGTIYLMDISPLLVKFQPYWISKLTTPWCSTNKLGPTISLPNCNLIAQTILILWAKI
jgi:hypothetical protein